MTIGGKARYTCKLVMLLAAVLLLGCGTSNQALKSQHPYLTISQSDADDTITLVRLASSATAEADYNWRYKANVSIPPGEYVLKAHDSAGGRYFSRYYSRNVTVQYLGPTISGKTGQDIFAGGVFVDAQGLPYLYWFWDDEVRPVRVPAPNLKVSVSTEIDQARVRAREERQERERQAAARQQEQEQERLAAARKLQAEQEGERLAKARQERKAALLAARTRDRVSCAGEQCDRAFAQGQAYLLKQADMRIQVATSTLIETYNPTEDGRISMRLLRIPTAGGRWEIVISAHCRDEKGNYEDTCTLKLLDAYSGFLPHMQRF